MSRAQEASNRAADWIIRREENDWSDNDQAALEAWLAESEGNKAAFWRLKYSWNEADRIGALGRQDDRRATNVETDAPRGFARWWKPMAIAASLTLAVGLGSGMYLANAPSKTAGIETTDIQSFKTPVGGHKIIALDDGSRVELNTASLVKTAISDAKREVWLDQGEAYFQVAHLNGRPFVVHAGSRTITVLGTKFSVRRDGDKVTVSVVEGRVRVADSDRPSVPTAVITAGDVAIAQGPSTLFTEASKERVDKALSWRGGMLTFDQSPLSEVAAEFNRYNRKPIKVSDPQTAEIRIGGVFPASDPDAFLRLLHDAYGLRVDNREDAIIVSN